MFQAYDPTEHNGVRDKSQHCADCFNEDNEWNDKVVCAIQADGHPTMVCLVHALARFARFITQV